MSRQLFQWAAAALLFVTAPGGRAADVAAVRPGDGAARIGSYDLRAGTVRVGAVDVPLAPAAASSLARQLGAFGIPAGREFGARFTVIKGASGNVMISTIVVYPPAGR
jgi:hypothetical protein